jgi:hypothetical protein
MKSKTSTFKSKLSIKLWIVRPRKTRLFGISLIYLILDVYNLLRVQATNWFLISIKLSEIRKKILELLMINNDYSDL